MKYIFLVLILLFEGCSLSRPPISQYRISPDIENKVYTQSSCKNFSLKIGQTFTSSALMSQKMKYAQGLYGEYTFSLSEWAQSPSKAISMQLLKSVRESTLFESVQSFHTRSRSDLTLENSVENFIQYFSEDTKTSYVSVSITMNLIDNKTNKSIYTKTFSKTLEAGESNAKAGVKALNKALSSVLYENNQWLSKVCE